MQNIKDGRVEDQKVSDIKGFVKTVKDNMGGAGVDLRASNACPFLFGVWSLTLRVDSRIVSIDGCGFLTTMALCV
jgi:hypothetical protein